MRSLTNVMMMTICPDNEDDNVGQEVAELYEDDFPESKNEVYMNTICDNIANALVSGG
jgi:hypothetical protein